MASLAQLRSQRPAGCVARQHMQQARSRGRPIQAASQERQACASTSTAWPSQLWQPQQQQHHQQQEQQQQLLPGRRAALAGLAAAGVLLQGLVQQPAQASVTLTLSRPSTLVPYTLKAGFSITVPSEWNLAYDRSDSAELGTQVFFGSFQTFDTLSIFKLAAPGGGELSPEQQLEAVIADQRDNQSTMAFSLLSGPVSRSVRAADGSEATFYDAEYELAICRGLVQEGAGGKRRCVGPRDMDLQIVARHFYQTLTVRDGFVYMVRGSGTVDRWPAIADAAQAAVRSFALRAP